ncbi:MAG: hypothetical protein JWP87_1251 [Labilithrix sp.]|nr:hypothetical protein [Labilithrix sp.]
MALLKRDDRCVIVPDVTIEPEMLRAILRSADVSETEFFKRVQRSGAYSRMTDDVVDRARRDSARPPRK